MNNEAEKKVLKAINDEEVWAKAHRAWLIACLVCLVAGFILGKL